MKEKEIAELPCPTNYDLSDINSIKKKVNPDIVKKFNDKRGAKLSSSFSRFNDSVYYPEKERLMQGNDSVSPVKYDPLAAYKLIRSNKTDHISFTKDNRKLEFKKESRESPSPTKYKVINENDLNPTAITKGKSIGKSKRELEFKIPTYY